MRLNSIGRDAIAAFDEHVVFSECSYVGVHVCQSDALPVAADNPGEAGRHEEVGEDGRAADLRRNNSSSSCIPNEV